MSSWADRFKKGFNKSGGKSTVKRSDPKEQNAYAEYLKNAPREEKTAKKRHRRRALGDIIKMK